MCHIVHVNSGTRVPWSWHPWRSRGRRFTRATCFEQAPHAGQHRVRCGPRGRTTPETPWGAPQRHAWGRGRRGPDEGPAPLAPLAPLLTSARHSHTLFGEFFLSRSRGRGESGAKWCSRFPESTTFASVCALLAAHAPLRDLMRPPSGPRKDRPRTTPPPLVRSYQPRGSARHPFCRPRSRRVHPPRTRLFRAS